MKYRGYTVVFIAYNGYRIWYKNHHYQFANIDSAKRFIDNFKGGMK